MPAKEHPFPLPNFSRTEPHLEIQPHAGMVNTLEKTISNREEIHPGKTKSELPLVAFTLLGQMAAGMALIQLFSGPFPLPVLISIGSLIVLAGLASLFHLGAPLNAWRGIVHLKKSWLSREVLMFVLFGASWLIAMAMPGMGKLPLAICGIGLVFCMAQVYRLRSIATWNSNHTLLAFPASSILLGGIGLKIVELLSKARIISNLPFVLIVAIGLVIALSASFWDRDHIFQSARRLRFGLIGMGIAGLLGILFIPEPTWGWVMIPTCLIFLFEEGIGRWLFYEHLHQRSL
jgi:DMSO reductase anchor subunit